MNKLFSIKFLPCIALVFSFSIFVTSCSDDPEVMVTGCTDPNADNYNPDANVSGDCEYRGCTDPEADNYDPNATVSGDCDYTGCMDPLAENYDANANIEGDCVYYRDKFLGDYLGSLNCPNTLTVLNTDSLVFSLVEGLEPDKPYDVILSITLNNFPLALAATVDDSDALSIMHTIPGVSIPDLPIVGTITGDVTADGNGTMSADQTTLTADLALEINSSDIPAFLNPIKDDCVITGIKQ